MTGRNVDAKEAERIGLVNRVAEPDDLTSVVDGILEAIFANGPTAVTSCIEAVNRGLGLDLDEGCSVEADLFAVGASSVEMEEGTRAFLEKRRAVFR